MMLVATIHDACLAWLQDVVHKGPLITFALGQKEFLRNGVIYIEPQMQFGLFGFYSGPQF
jgi:hypothetical protein